MNNNAEQAKISATSDAKVHEALKGLDAEVRNHNKKRDRLMDTHGNAAQSSVEAIGNPFPKMRSEGEVRAFALKLDEYIRYCQVFDSVGGATEVPPSNDMSDSRFIEMAAEHGPVYLSSSELAYLKGRLSTLRWVQGYGLDSPEDDLYLN